MSFLYNNFAPIVIALVVSLVAWLFGGTRGELLVPVVPWLFVLMLEVIFCFPQRHKNETIYEARARVWQDLKQSPIAWLSVGLMVLLLIPFVNNGLCTSCDAELIAQGKSPAPFLRVFPFCVNRLDHLDVVLWMAIALSALLAVRYCLTRQGRRLVIELIVWNGVALAIFGFVQSAMGAPGPFWNKLPPGSVTYDFFSSFGYANMAGDYFTTLFGLSIALWRDCYEHHYKELSKMDLSELSSSDARKNGQFWRRHYFLIPAIIFFFAALYTLSRAAFLLVTISATVYFIHTLVISLSRMSRRYRVSVGVKCIGAFLLVLFFANLFMPDEMRREVNSLGATEMLDRVSGRNQRHVKIATKIWNDHLLFGCGGWGYKHFAVPKMNELGLKPSNWELIGGINVHNDYVQVLAEHGIVGLSALILIAVLLVLPIFRQWRALVKSYRFKNPRESPPKPIQIFALPAAAFFILVTAVSTLIHAFCDCPFRSCAVLTLFYVSLASLSGFMPKHETSHHH